MRTKFRPGAVAAAGGLAAASLGLTIQGSSTSTIERGYPGSLPLMWVGTSDGLTFSRVNFKNGDAPYGGAIYGKNGPVTGARASRRYRIPPSPAASVTGCTG